MKIPIKYILYLLAVVALVATMVYMRDSIGLWLSRVGTYIVILCTTFLSGWVLGYWGARNKYKTELGECQKQLKQCETAKSALQSKSAMAVNPSKESSAAPQKP